MTSSLNPMLIVIARHARGLSQADLAERIAINQGFLSKIENGVKEPSDEVVKKISEVLKFPVTFFYQREEIYGLPVSVHPMHRKKSVVGIKGLEILYAEMNINIMHIRRLLQSVELAPRTTLPRLDIDEYNYDIEKIAALTRSMWLLPRGPVENLTKCIENAGCIVIHSDFHNIAVDAITWSIHGMPTCIFLNRDRPADRMRFTLAHELGHIVMHQHPTPQMEDQADVFASAFLMPHDEIAESICNRVTLERLAYLKPIWRVSIQSILMRAANLGIINKTQSEYLWKKINYQRWRFREPPELDFAHEEPRLFPSIIKLHLEKLGYSLSELSSALHIHEEEFRSKYFAEKNIKHPPNLFLMT